MKRVYVRKALHAFNALSLRERWLVILAFVGLGLWGATEMYSVAQASQESSEVEIARRSAQLRTLSVALQRYRVLSAKVRSIEETYAKSELSVEQVFTELDKVLKGIIGSDPYDLRPTNVVTSLGSQAEQQSFVLRIRSITLEQLVKLLYELEQGKVPLSLGKLDLTKGSQPGNFAATLEISSIRRKRAGAPNAATE